jgi:hypothetical protein
MKHYVSSDISRSRVSKWMVEAKPVDENPTWIETRQAIDFGGHTYIVNDGQVFQCAHCGYFDPDWVATEVLSYFQQFGVKSYDIEVECTVKISKK